MPHGTWLSVFGTVSYYGRLRMVKFLLTLVKQNRVDYLNCSLLNASLGRRLKVVKFTATFPDVNLNLIFEHFKKVKTEFLRNPLSEDLEWNMMKAKGFYKTKTAKFLRREINIKNGLIVNY